MNKIIRMINGIQVTKACENCMSCGLPEPVCICETMKSLSDCGLEIKIHIILHERETKRNTNTGRLPGMLFGESVQYYVWKRKDPPRDLVDRLSDEDKLFVLLYPASEDAETLKPDEVIHSSKEESKEVHLVVVDGTWQETVKMVNRSSYLNEMSRLHLTHNVKSKFTLRKNQKDGNLCTSEAIALALDQLNEKECSNSLHEFTSLYLQKYEKGRSGPGL